MKRITKKTINKLLTEARNAREFSYAPYSNFHVGAAVMTRSGMIFRGCNIENSSYGLTICAERAAIFNALSSGVKDIVAIAISCNDKKICTPCGACRQVIYEFSEDCLIIIDRKGGYIIKNIRELLPLGFGI
ncbi:MAG: cytidine deaminase [Nitrospirota bacterium]